MDLAHLLGYLCFSISAPYCQRVDLHCCSACLIFYALVWMGIACTFIQDFKTWYLLSSLTHLTIPFLFLQRLTFWRRSWMSLNWRKPRPGPWLVSWRLIPTALMCTSAACLSPFTDRSCSVTLVWSSTLAVGMALLDSMEPVSGHFVHIGLIDLLLVT